jgi:hypothetical protein
MKCDICGCENGSCNRYETRDGRRIVICPGCLVFDTSPLATQARYAQAEKRLIKDEAEKGKRGRR